MIKSKFRLRAYFGIVCIYIMMICLLLSFVMCFYFLVNEKPLAEVLLICGMCLLPAIMFYYLLSFYKVIIDINEQGIEYHGVIPPFKNKCFKVFDADSFVLRRDYQRYQGWSDTVLLLRNNKIVFRFNSLLYNNFPEIVNSLPWKYRGYYRPRFIDEFKFLTINENRIYQQ